MDDERPAELPALDQAFLASMQQGLTELAIAYGTDASLDIAFVVFLRRMSRFGYFTYGPISIDVRLVEDILDRTAPRRTFHRITGDACSILKVAATSMDAFEAIIDRLAPHGRPSSTMVLSTPLPWRPLTPPS